MLDTLRDTIVTQNINGCAAATQEALDSGMTAVEIINGGLSVGMKIIGDKFEAAEVYLPQIMVCKGYDLIQGRIGVDAISVDQNVDAAAAVANVEKAVIVGNLDPVNMLWNQPLRLLKNSRRRLSMRE